jgi:cytochrome c peroxidase
MANTLKKIMLSTFILLSTNNILIADIKEIDKDEVLIKKITNSGIVPIPLSKNELLKLIDNPNNRITKDKFNLGKKLFFDPRLSSSGLISCNTCHNIGLNGIDGIPIAIGDKWTLNPHAINSPTVYNAVFNEKQFWDGRSDNLEAQAIGPIQAAPEMNSTPEFVKNFIMNTPEYLESFRIIKDNVKYEPNIQDVGDVIAVFERTLITPSKLDSYITTNGKEIKFTTQERSGANLFIDKGCVSCHAGVALGGSMMPFPIYKPYKYENIGDFKGDKNGMVKVPTLRNINETGPYFHNGQVKTLSEAIQIMGETQLNIVLKDKEIEDIEVFLKTFTGIKSNIIYPMLPETSK